jgi:hypothetical protein
MWYSKKTKDYSLKSVLQSFPLGHLSFFLKAMSSCSALVVRIFFINPRPAYRDTEKDGEGERDTGITSGKSVTRYVAQGYLRTYSLGRWRGTRETSPHIILPLRTFLRLLR